MRDWPHSPVHRISEAGTYIVTAGTYQKVHLFRSRPRLDFLCDSLLNTAEKHSWKLQAWAVFPNHYHFVAISPGDAPSLRTLIQELHSLTAREINRLDRTPSRKVWFEYWDSRITFEKSYFARLSYVHQNAIHHGLVSLARDYPWCSAAWFERTANTGLYRTIASFTGKGVKVRDDYVVEPDEIGPA